MLFWLAIFLCMTLSNLTTLTAAVLLWKWSENRKLMLAKIERGNAAFEHLLNNRPPVPPPPNTVPFPKKAE